MSPLHPLRVMHVVYCLGSGGRTGGMEYGVIKLANAMDRSRVQTAVCSTRTADPAIVNLLDSSVPSYECHGRRGNDPKLVLSLWSVFRQFRPDIVHTHGWGTLLEGVLAARLARVPRLVHGEHGTLQTRRHQLLLQRFLWRRVDQMLSVSSVLAGRLAREVRFDMSRIRTIRNGVDLERFDPSRRGTARHELGLSDDMIAIGTVGRLEEVKDHALLLEAFSRVARDHPRAVLLIAGDGPLASWLAQRAEALGVELRVRFLGHRPDVETVLAALDLFVLSSRSEGLSNTILEAMASGVPVVATHVGGADELVLPDLTGLLVPAGRPEEFASAMTMLVGDQAARVRMGAAARERAKAEFSLSRMVTNYRDLYEGLYAAPLALVGQRAAAAPSRAVGDRR